MQTINLAAFEALRTQTGCFEQRMNDYRDAIKDAVADLVNTAVANCPELLSYEAHNGKEHSVEVIMDTFDDLLHSAVITARSSDSHN